MPLGNMAITHPMTQPTDKLAQVASEVLRPCPFCGGEASGSLVRVGVQRDADYYEVGCVTCCVSMSSRPDAPAVAVAAWNRRAVTEQAATIARLRGLVADVMRLYDAVDVSQDRSEVDAYHAAISRLRAEGATS